MNPDPFGALGLPVRPDLTDDDVRVAWRRIAAATHPDRADGGDPDRFAVAAAAYTELRTRFGRGEAYADLAAGLRQPATWTARTVPPVPAASAGPTPVPTVSPAPTVPPGAVLAPGRGVAARIRLGRPWMLVLRLVIAAAVSLAAFAAAGTQPAAVGLTVGAVTWFLLTARRDLAPPRS